MTRTDSATSTLSIEASASAVAAHPTRPAPGRARRRLALGRLALGRVAAAGAVATVLISGPAQAREDAPQASQLQQVPGYWRTALGDTVITALYDGRTFLPRSLLKGIEGKSLEQLLATAFVPTGKDGVQTSVNAYLVNQGGRLTLIDAGTASCFGPGLGQVVDNLRASGHDPAAVDTVLVTHLHGDHVCGATTTDGKMAFPNAELVAPQAEADFWLSEAIAAKAPKEAQAFFKMSREAVAPYKAAGKFRTFKAGEDPLVGIKAVPSHGHTPGHTSYLIASGAGNSVLIWGDIVHSHSVQFAHPNVTLEFDVDGKAALASRKRIFAQAADGKLWVAGAHLPFPGIGHVGRQGQAWRWVPAEYGPVDLKR